MIQSGHPPAFHMRIAMYCHFWLPYHYAGSEVMALELLKFLRGRGHEILVVANMEPDAPDVWEYEGITAVSESEESSAYQKLADFGPDLIITHHQSTRFAVEFGRVHNVPVAHMIHNHMPMTDKNLNRGGDFAIYNTEFIREHYELSFSYPNCVLHPPVYPENHATAPGDKITLINVSENKGASLFYDLVARNPQWDFLAVEGGHGTQHLEKWPNVTIQRQTRDMKNDVWSRTGILLVPSIYESYGLVAVEAMASGIPVLAHPTDGLQESLSFAGTFLHRDDTASWEREIAALREPENWQAKSEMSVARSRQLHPNKELEDTSTRLEQLVGLRNNSRY